jgi:hypothetical protein
MPKTYAATSATLQPATLGDAELIAIGKLIRATAEIEDLITLHICNLAEISMTKATVLLGKLAVTRRLEIAEYLARMAGQSVLTAHKQAFAEPYGEIMSCRNAVAHGVLMGRTEDGRYAFLTAVTAPSDQPTAIQIVQSYLPGDIAGFAEMAENAVQPLIGFLKLEALRAERLRRPLEPHRKGQPRSAKANDPSPQGQA